MEDEGKGIARDLDDGMLAVAARTEPEIVWQRRDAGSLPLEGVRFAAVVSQFANMYFPDRVACRNEMWRTLASGGHLAVAPWHGWQRSSLTLFVVATRPSRLCAAIC